MDNINKISSFRGDYYFLSNFYEAPVYYDGICYKNSEAAFQAQKCFQDADRFKFVSLTAAESKKLGRQIKLRSDWDQIKVSVMKDIVYAKFTQNPDLLEKLLKTNDAYLEEGNTWGDRIWGTVNGSGANLLGQILMSLREDFISNKNKSTNR